MRSAGLFLGLTSLIQLASGAAITRHHERSLPACPSSSDGDYDYIVVGAGAGGGPVAARLALSGYSVLLIDAGHDVVDVNTTVPLYFGRASQDPQTTLNYEAALYAPGSSYGNVTDWYPRASALGGSTIHNALINYLQIGYDFDSIATLLDDPSWSAANIWQYFTAIENNLYIPESEGAPLGHGYSGWLYTDEEPTTLLTNYPDQQLVDIFNGVQNSAPFIGGNADINANTSDGLVGGGLMSYTKNPIHNRTSIRDHLVSTQASGYPITFLLDTLATKILTCGSTDSPQAYGIEYAEGVALLPVATGFQGKQALSLTNVTAKYEVIISAGVYQTPQLLMLSGIGDSDQLNDFGIETLVDLPGVGANFQDRLEMSVIWNLQDNFTLYEGCTFGNTVEEDPCLAAWVSSNHTNLYASGPALWGFTTKSNDSLPYIDVWTMWSPAYFNGYYPGYPLEIANHTNSLSAIILKAHTHAQGWVKLTGNDPQDTLDINKNLYATAESQNDLVVLREAIKSARFTAQNTTLIWEHIESENWPGSDVSTDDEIDAFIVKEAWGHHACCTAKLGPSSDPMAVVDTNFSVYGVSNLRIVDISVWPNIPGIFVTTPIYMIAEKAADAILATASSNSWTPAS